jgi:prevent-host-death family protein
MVQMTAREAKNNFGELLDTAQREPVTITRQGRAVAVLVSQQEYARLQALEDAHWAAHADAALRQAKFLGSEASLIALKQLAG